MIHLLIDGVLAAIFTSLFAGLGGLLIFCKKKYSKHNIDFMLNIAAGIMLASSVFTLLAPAVAHLNEVEPNRYISGLLIILAILLGVGLIWVLHAIIPHEHETTGKHGEQAIDMQSSLLFIFAIAIHKFPEGLAVGVAYAGHQLFDPTALVIGMALQNIPEGLMIAISLVAIDFSRGKAALLAMLSGLMQPIGAVLGIMAIGFGPAFVPLGMAMAGGIMLFVIINEVLPETAMHRNEEKRSAAILGGFIFMTYLSVVLG